MIKFFRKIRQKLLAENKFNKYLIYAVGEVILVVIGILIALAINDWNQNRKTERLEISLLSEMKVNLLADIIDMKINQGYHERGIESANFILSSFETNLIPSDSLNKHYGKVSLIPKFLMTETAYTSMQKEGMRIIKNDSLRNEITLYYENRSQYMMDWNEAEWNVQFQDSRDISRKYFKEFQVFKDLIPVDYNDLRQSQDYKNYLNNRIGWLTVTVSLYKRLNGSAQSLIDSIDNELDLRTDN